MTFDQKFPKLNSRPVYCWRLYSICLKYLRRRPKNISKLSLNLFIFFLISYSGVEISITGITIIIELPSHVCFRHQFPPQVLKKCHVWHNHQLWRSTRQNLNYCYWHHNGAKYLQIFFFQMRSTCYFVHQIDIINNKARNNRINAKYCQIAFRSVPTNPYLESLVKQKLMQI